MGRERGGGGADGGRVGDVHHGQITFNCLQYKVFLNRLFVCAFFEVCMRTVHDNPHLV